MSRGRWRCGVPVRSPSRPELTGAGRGVAVGDELCWRHRQRQPRVTGELAAAGSRSSVVNEVGDDVDAMLEVLRAALSTADAYRHRRSRRPRTTAPGRLSLRLALVSPRLLAGLEHDTADRGRTKPANGSTSRRTPGGARALVNRSAPRRARAAGPAAPGVRRAGVPAEMRPMAHRRDHPELRRSAGSPPRWSPSSCACVVGESLVAERLAPRGPPRAALGSTDGYLASPVKSGSGSPAPTRTRWRRPATEPDPARRSGPAARGRRPSPLRPADPGDRSATLAVAESLTRPGLSAGGRPGSSVCSAGRRVATRLLKRPPRVPDAARCVLSIRTSRSPWPPGARRAGGGLGLASTGVAGPTHRTALAPGRPTSPSSRRGTVWSLTLRRGSQDRPPPDHGARASTLRRRLTGCRPARNSLGDYTVTCPCG